MMQYFGVENGRLISKTTVTLNVSNYTIVEDKKRYQISMNRFGTNFLIDVGYDENQRSTIICDDMSQLIYALGLIRLAFPDTKK